MYVADSRSSKAPVAPAAGQVRRGAALRAVPGAVLVLGTVSMVTDVSSEMVNAVLPLYLLTGLGLSPLGFGLLDGIQNGFSALVRLVGGHLADRRGRDGAARHKAVAAVGYGLSALCRPLLLFVHTVPLIGAVIAVDRTGKGLRTAPRDAMISLATEPAHRGRAFGVHRPAPCSARSPPSWCCAWPAGRCSPTAANGTATTRCSPSAPASPHWAC